MYYLGNTRMVLGNFIEYAGCLQHQDHKKSGH